MIIIIIYIIAQFLFFVYILFYFFLLDKGRGLWYYWFMELFTNDWGEVLSPIINSEYFVDLMEKLADERKSYDIFPGEKDVFRAFNLTAYKETRVVIVGQDPYHTPGVADGLAFSTRADKLPPSLRNIFKELEDDLGIKNSSGDLSSWAQQGVLLLNRTFSVRSGQPLSHDFLNWKVFTDFVLEKLNDHPSPLVFVLWGKEAQALEKNIDDRHAIIKSAHPSPLSAYRGFFGSGVFAKINEALINFGYQPIDFKTR